MSSTPEIPVHRVEDRELRRIFNEEERILERTLAGELIVIAIETYHEITSPDEPPGTVGKMLSYRDPANNDFEVCRAYAYIRPDGTFGGRGVQLPDPKIIFHRGALYKQLRGPREQA